MKKMKHALHTGSRSARALYLFIAFNAFLRSISFVVNEPQTCSYLSQSDFLKVKSFVLRENENPLSLVGRLKTFHCGSRTLVGSEIMTQAFVLEIVSFKTRNLLRHCSRWESTRVIWAVKINDRSQVNDSTRLRPEHTLKILESALCDAVALVEATVSLSVGFELFGACVQEMYGSSGGSRLLIDDTHDYPGMYSI